MLRALGALGLLGVAALLGSRRVVDGHRRGGAEVQLADNAMMDGANMDQYREMFARHNEIRRTVTDIPGGVRATTESNSPDLIAQLQAHVSDVYSRLDHGIPVMGAATSATLPILVRNAANYRRQLILTPAGVSIEETTDDPALTQLVRDHAREVSGFVDDGMPAALQPMMGGMGMGPGGMGGMGMGPGGPRASMPPTMPMPSGGQR